MSLFRKDIDTLDDLFLHFLQTMYYAERRITEALPKMIDLATSPDLKASFEQHLRETEVQIDRLEQVFRMHGAEPQETACPAIDGIIKAGNTAAGDIADSAVLDAALIAAGQMVEHYEIAEYGSMIAWARELGHDDRAAVLQTTLDEEQATDAKLSQLAEATLNRQAQHA